ncbi:MAG: hypothetical protein ACYCQI_15835 [Gammaproteobacteria bacterium]
MDSKRQEEKSEDLILFDIPSGKKYPTAKEPVTQEAQKGNTCWYYIFNYLRPRIGKIAELENKLDEKEADKDELIHARKVEKIISTHRKKTYLLDVHLQHGFELSKYCNTRERAAKELKEFNQDYDALMKAKNNPALYAKLPERIKKLNLVSLIINIEILERFLAQSQDATLNRFAVRIFNEDFVNACKETISKLGFDPEKELRRQRELITNQPFKVVISEGQDQKMLFNMVVHRLAAESYHLKSSAWIPKNGFQALRDALAKEGPLAIGAHLGIPFYIDDPKPGGNVGKYQTFFWPKGSQKSIHIQGHYILLVGAEQVTTKAGATQDTVLFIDPYDQSIAGEPRKVYRVSFKTLCENISNTLGLSGVPVDKMKGPFAYCADPEYKKEIEQQITARFGKS